MSLELTGYREWDGRRRAAAWACLSIVRTGLSMIIRRWVFWGLIGLGLFNFLFNFAFIYLKATLVVQNRALGNFLDNYQVTGTGKAYADFMFAQASITALLLAFAGSALIGNDYRHGGIVFFLSRRIGRRHYIVGKLLTIAAVVTIITTLPALVLYFQYGFLSNSMDYFYDNPRILLGICGYGAVLAAVQSVLLFAVAAWVPRTVPLVMSWLGIFVLVRGLAEALRAIDDNRAWLLLSVWEDMQRVGQWCFGSLEADSQPEVWQCTTVLACLSAVCLGLIFRRVRAVEVVK
jgi:ABC-2 type transport system permease protein